MRIATPEELIRTLSLAQVLEIVLFFDQAKQPAPTKDAKGSERPTVRR